MKLVLVRHGQTDQNKNFLIQGRSDFPLNKIGIREAEKAAKIIKKNFKSFDFYYSSPLKRALMTGKIIRKTLDEESKPITLDPSFYERDFGPYEGMKVKDVFPNTKPVPGYETDQEIIQRVSCGIEDLRKKHLGKTIIITCHSHTIKAFLIKAFPDKFDFGSRLSNCAIFVIDYNDEKPILEKILNN